MISFGELRKKSLEWKVELSDVEHIYALDWLVSGIFLRPALAPSLALNGESALALAYFPAAPRVKDVDLIRTAELDPAVLEQELTAATEQTAQASGLQFRLVSFQDTQARIEFTGPLGRRSAAQPLIVVRVSARQPRLEPTVTPLVHPFREPLDVPVRAVALEEMAAERIVGYAQKPRGRDVFDLWLILTLGASRLDAPAMRTLAQHLGETRHVRLSPTLDPAYAPLLARSWDKSLAHVSNVPSFAQAQSDIEIALRELGIAA